ncbi:MAG: glycosyltransferase [Ruminiclostridium sp.]|nr:glycosyltransferase [Ruminiclostridium sp.]
MISVIVPVYNVEPYLAQCLDSLLAQTFSDIEIIVVDDGSTDGCPQICDEYSRRDERITVFHTDNHGLSAARNLGIDNSHGEWLMFVDSDDWVEPQFCELPYRAAVENEADLVIFDVSRIFGEKRIPPSPIPVSGIVTWQEAFEHGRPAAWNKLYKRYLFDTIRYPVGRLFEDIAVTHKLINYAKRIVYIDDSLYNYRIHSGSISKTIDERTQYEELRSRLEQYTDIMEYGYPEDKAKLLIFRIAIKFLEKCEPSDDQLYHRAEEIVSTFEIDPDRLNAHERNCLKIWKLNKNLLNTWYQEKKRGESDAGIC